MKNPVQTYEANTEGRDFVIGDIHGSYGVFKNLLVGLNFDPAVDRMFSVGDLVDRGPRSPDCLELIYEPWFKPVLANHEQMMVECFNGGYMGRYWYRNGGDWGMEAVGDYHASMAKPPYRRFPTDENARIIDMVKLVEELPYLITVNTKSGKKYHILHAELPQNEGLITDEMLTDPETVRKLAKAYGGDGDAFTWNRAVYMYFYKKNLGNRELILETLAYNKEVLDVFNDNLSHIISGHTIVQKPLTIGGQTNIDTGAYHSIYTPPPPYSTYSHTPPEWAGLTCVELDTWKFYRATETGFFDSEPYVITRDEVDAVILDAVKNV